MMADVLTSADVKYTFDSIINRTVTSPKRGSLSLVKSIETPDAGTVIFHLSEPYAGFLWSIYSSGDRDCACGVRD